MLDCSPRENRQTTHCGRSRWFSGRCAVTAACALALSAEIAAGEMTVMALDRTDCDIIERYDRRIGVPSLLEQFEAMALRAEWCLEAGGPCELTHLQRWEGPFELSVSLGEGFEAAAPAVQAALNGVDVGFSFVAQILGVDPADMVRMGATQLDGDDALVVVAIASRQELPAIAASHERFQKGIDLVGSAEIGLRQETACWGVVSDAAANPGRIDRAFIYIDGDLPFETLVKCGKEEALNIFIVGDPIGDASIFDDPWGRGPADPVLGAQFSARDEVLLRILHHRALFAGMPTKSARDAAAEAIESDCG